MIELLDTSMQAPVVLPERHGKQELLLCRIAQQERALRFALEQLLGLVPIHLAPVETAAGDLLQIRHQAVDEVDLNIAKDSIYYTILPN